MQLTVQAVWLNPLADQQRQLKHAKKLAGKPAALRINQPAIGSAIINTYSTTCVAFAAKCCTALRSLGKAGVWINRRLIKRRQTNTPKDWCNLIAVFCYVAKLWIIDTPKTACRESIAHWANASIWHWLGKTSAGSLLRSCFLLK